MIDKIFDNIKVINSSEVPQAKNIKRNTILLKDKKVYFRANCSQCLTCIGKTENIRGISYCIKQ